MQYSYRIPVLVHLERPYLEVGVVHTILHPIGSQILDWGDSKPRFTCGVCLPCFYVDQNYIYFGKSMNEISPAIASRGCFLVIWIT